MSNRTICKIIEMLRFPELDSPETYAFTLNGEKLFKKWWNGKEDETNLHLSGISTEILEEIRRLVINAEGEVLSKEEGFLEKIIDNYKILYFHPPASIEHTIDFYRLGTTGFPWPEIKECLDNKWPFVLTKEKLSYLDRGLKLTETVTDVKTLIAVKEALHRNAHRLETVYGLYQDELCPVNSYTLTNGDNVVLYINGIPLEIRYLPENS